MTNTEALVKGAIFQNLFDGLGNLLELVEGFNKNTCIDTLLITYGQLDILIYRSMNSFSNEIAYPAQALKNKIQTLISNKVYK